MMLCAFLGCANKPMSNSVIMECQEFIVDADTIFSDSLFAVASSPQTMFVVNKKASPHDTLHLQISSYPTLPHFTSPSNLLNVMCSDAIEQLALHAPKPSIYSIMLTDAVLRPKLSMNHLKSLVANNRVMPSQGYGGGWPVVSGRVAWACAAWEVYMATGDLKWLEYCREVVKNTIADDREVLLCRHTSLMQGAPHFLSNIGECYPVWMEAKDVFETTNLSVNVLYARAYAIMELICDELGRTMESKVYHELYNDAKDAINQNLWNDDRGLYSEYLYGQKERLLSPGIDNMGQALAVIWDIADDERAVQLIRNTPVNFYGVPITHPWNGNSHSSAQAVWNIAASYAENESAFRYGLGAQLLNFTETVAKKQVLSSQQIAGNLSDAFFVLMGITLKPNGIEFFPFVPQCLKGDHTLTGLKYRGATLDISIHGFGSAITSMKLDGNQQSNNFLPANITGHHTIDITLNLGKMSPQNVTVAKKHKQLVIKQPKPSIDSTTCNTLKVDKFTSTTENIIIELSTTVEKAGNYYIDALYENGDSTTRTNCAVRMLFINNHAQGALVMPHRDNGKGYSNALKVSLLRGRNTLQLKYIEPQCCNASANDNSALIHSLRLGK